MKRRFFSLLLAGLMCACTAFPAFAAENTFVTADGSAPEAVLSGGSETGQVRGSLPVKAQSAADGTFRAELGFQFIQSDARTMINGINDFRTGSEAWAWDESNSSKKMYSGLAPLTYDYQLEQIAMQRAAEIAFMYAATGQLTHQRPDGSLVSKLMMPEGYYAEGENILLGTNKGSAEALEQWKENGSKYEGQGHRRNMLNPDFQGVGVGHVKMGAIDFWVQDFASPVKADEGVDIPDGSYYVPLTFRQDEVYDVKGVDDGSYLYIGVGERSDVSSVPGSFDWMALNDVYAMIDVDKWTSSDPSIASVDNGSIVGRSRGITSLKADITAGGSIAEIEVPVYCGIFYDVTDSSSWFYDSVYWAVDKGITSGTGNNMFEPGTICSRAQAVTFIWKAMGSPEPQGGRQFSDVSADAWYAKAVQWAVSQGITSGTGDGKFSPDMDCSRAQIVTLLWNAANKPQPASDVNSFSDVHESAWYYKAVLWAAGEGITSGMGDGRFCPDTLCSRSQIVTMLKKRWTSKNR